jgi:hypothetical protein
MANPVMHSVQSVATGFKKLKRKKVSCTTLSAAPKKHGKSGPFSGF